MKKITFLKLIGEIVITSLFLSSLIFAAIINVPAEYATIQAGIDAASFGDTVRVAVGTYVENISLKSGIILEGAEAIATTIDEKGNKKSGKIAIVK